MQVEELVTFYPRLYHMAERGSWQSIREHGLLSTSALLDFFEITGEERNQLEERHRPEKVTIEHPRLGEIIIRDQKPMSDKTLNGCLCDELTPREWYRLLNGKVFFWVSEERLTTLLQARPYRNDAHDVLTIDTRRLVERYSEQIHLSPINSGASVPWKHPRGLETFRPIAEYPFSERRRRNKEPVVELVVDYAVPDIAEFVISVDVMQGAHRTNNLYSSP